MGTKEEVIGEKRMEVKHEAIFERKGQGYYGFRKVEEGCYGEYLFKSLKLYSDSPTIRGHWFAPVWRGSSGMVQKCYLNKKSLLLAMAKQSL